MPTLYLDLETYSACDLKRAGSHRYAIDPTTEVLMVAYALDDGPVRVAVGRDAIDRKVMPDVLDPEVLKVAHNTSFDRVVLSGHAGIAPAEWLDVDEWDDTMPLAAEHGYPQGLDKLAKALGVTAKDPAGSALVRFWSSPVSAGVRKGQRRMPADSPDRWQAFVAYCAQDVDTLRKVHQALPPWPEGELAVWRADQRVNDRGVLVDVDTARAASEAGMANAERDRAELAQLTGLANPNSPVQLLGWLRAHGVEVVNLKAATVTALLADGELLDPTARRALELRQALALTAAKKFDVMVDRAAPDDRVRGTLQFFGAHTGRWAGRGVQLQNLPRASFTDEHGDFDEAAQDRALDTLQLVGTAEPETLKALIRPCLVGPLVVADYSAIEARVVAWLAGEAWALDAFREGQDIYVATASRMTEVTGRPMTRQQGKAATLGLGYGGGVNALRNVGAKGTDDELKPLVTAWREANPRIVQLWSSLEHAFLRGGEAGPVSIERAGRGVRRMWLPSGRAVTYRGCAMRQRRDPKTAEWITDRNGERRKFLSYQQGTGQVAYTWGGSLTENLVQAVARDVLAAALVRLDAEGWPVVAHVHDEVLCEAAPGVTLDGLREAMCALPAWAEGLPLNAEGYVADRYRKG